jgi:hypothetical protein
MNTMKLVWSLPVELGMDYEAKIAGNKIFLPGSYHKEKKIYFDDDEGTRIEIRYLLN